MNFQAGFQAVPFNSGGVLEWTSPFIKWGGLGNTSPLETAEYQGGGVAAEKEGRTGDGALAA